MNIHDEIEKKYEKIEHNLKWSIRFIWGSIICLGLVLAIRIIETIVG